MRHVKGILFVDHVRMLRGHKGEDWSTRLPPEDVVYLNALEVPTLHDDVAEIVIRYHMGMPAEEAAALQTVDAKLRQRSWIGDPRTLLALRWTA